MLPFPQTAEGAAAFGVGHLALKYRGGSMGVQVIRPRTLPGFSILRVPKFGRGLSEDDVYAAIRVLIERAVKWNVLSVQVEAWTERAAEMAAIAKACETSHFVRRAGRTYSTTIWMDLRPPEEDIFMGLHKTARQNIRAPGKKGMEVRVISRPSLGPRLDNLLAESFRRTGGAPPDVDWARWIQLSATSPDRVHIMGLFDKEDVSGERPLAFAVGIRHGEVAEYAFAGSTREGTRNVPLLYAPAWELIKWSKRQGAMYWDFGGVSLRDPDSEDPRAGINEFKRYFSRDVVRVGQEWAYVCRPWLDKVLKVSGRLRGSVFN